MIWISYFFNLKPKFILPSKYFDQNKFIIHKIVIASLVVSVLLLPLDLQFITSKKIITEKILPVQIVYDVSLSMAADDIQPSRFVSAQKALIDLISQLDGYNVSLITFSGIPFIYIPFSTDTNAIISKFSNTNLADFPPTQDFIGTAIWDALLLAIKNLDKIRLSDINYPWIIILITDWDSNKWYDPMQVLGIINKKNVPVFTLWVWNSNYLIWYDKWGSSVKTSINIPLLQDISKQTWGEFARILSDSNFDEFFSHVKDVIKAQEKQKIENQYLSINQYLLYIILISLSFLFYIRLRAFS